ncbi:PAS domain S-box protein [Candidatus Magnetobacterium casense]|uniref:histidine kinase n=1 Tax=Candidatus Magnetobacterium casense TaxID=1455061 RepID=A0ABS6RW94_9BACT|nr:PAS domain S-box protein [Candidatus Magnetobacterium casensis]MBV6340906.1 PAS domain S-box protein [Candidatus Magnetobacterium casensis]
MTEKKQPRAIGKEQSLQIKSKVSKESNVTRHSTLIDNVFKWGGNRSENKQMFKVIFEQAPVGIAIVHSSTGKFVKVNTAYCNILGYTQEEMLNLGFQEITYPGDLQTEMDNMKLLISGEIQSFNMEKRHIRKDGQIVWVNINEVRLWESLEYPTFHINIADEITEKKRMSTKLRESEERYRNLFDQSPDAILIADPKTGDIVDANQTASVLLGRPVSEIKGMHQSQLHPKDKEELSKELFKELIRDLINNGSVYPIEIDVVRSNGDKIPCEVLAQIIYHNGSPFVQGVFRDVSLRRYMEAVIKKERDKLKAITDAITIGLLIINRQYHIELVNDAMISDFGEVNGRRCYEYFHDRTEPCSWCSNGKEFVGETVKREWYSPKSKKTYSLLDAPISNVDGSASKFVIFFDITDIKQVQARQKRELDFQRAAAEVARVSLAPESRIYDIAVVINRYGMMLTDSLHGYVAEVDKDSNDMVGHTLTAMMHDGMCNIESGQQKAVFPRGDNGYNALWGHSLNIKEGFYTNNPQKHHSYKGCAPEGHVPIYRFLSVPAKIKDNLIGQITLANAERDYTDEDLDFINRLAHIYAIAIDRKRMEEELKILNTTLETRVAKETETRQKNEQLLIQQSKMAAMGEMLVLIAHQWKQPLNILSIFVQDLKEAYRFGELNDQYINNISDNSMNQILFMSKTMDDFRNFFKPSKDKVIFDVKLAVEELVFLFSKIFTSNGICIGVKEVSSSKLLVVGYPNEFKQVMLNLLNNSRDAIILRKNAETINGKIEIKFDKDETKNEAIISIRDNGGGIPQDVMDRIFEPYYTTKGTEGTGVGLYMSRTIIETNMNGKLTVSNVDGGAEFRIALMCS